MKISPLLVVFLFTAAADAQHLRQSKLHKAQDLRKLHEEVASDPSPSPLPAPVEGATANGPGKVTIHDLLGLEDMADVPITRGVAGGLHTAQVEEVVAPVELVRIVIDCPESTLYTECVQKVKSILDVVCGGKHGAKTLHELPTAQAVAASIHGSYATALEEAIKALPGFEMEIDKGRGPFYLRDSVHVLTEEEIARGDDIQESSIGEHERLLQTVGASELTYGLAMVKAREAWSEFGTTGTGATVCIIDSGVFVTHPDLDRSNINGYTGGGTVNRWNTDAEGHGTHVSGTIAAQSNGIGVVGIAPGVDLFIVRVFSNDGNFFGSDIVAAGEACVQANADVISMSLGGPEASRAEQRFFNSLEPLNIIAVAASGNEGDTYNYPNYPAAYTNVMGVAAVDSLGNVASFSTHNNFVDVAAPGVQIRSTWNDGGYATIDGTSMATPHVAGVAALLKAYRPSATLAQISNAMQSSARDRGAAGRDEFYGAGIVDALAALRTLSGTNGSGSATTPVQAPVSPPVDAPVPAPTPQNSCVQTTVLVITDSYGEENSFSLRDVGDNNRIIFIEQVLDPNTRYTRNECLNLSGCYRFAIFDSYGDGISGSGRGAQVRFGDEVVYSRRSFGSGDIIFFGGGCP